MPKRIPDRLSKAAKKRHIASGGDGNCPFCGDENTINLDYEDFDSCEGGVEQKAKCYACGHEWVDVFKLVDVFGIGEKGIRE